MMCDFNKSTENVGLKIHPDKTEILINQSTNKRKDVEIKDVVEIECEMAWATIHFSNRKQLRSKTEPERPGHCSTVQTRVHNTDSAYSTW